MASAEEVKAKLSEEQLQELREGFNSVDTDGGGSLDAGEVLKFLKQIGQRPTLEDVERLVADVDQDGNGEIDFDEFCVVMARTMTKQDPEEAVRWAYHLFDTANTGHISPEELVETFLAELGESLAVEEAREMLAAADFDGDGHVTYEDFAKLLSVAPTSTSDA